METIELPDTTDYSLIPSWSGELWVTSDGKRAFMSIHNDDQRSHSTGEGWELLSITDDVDDDATVYTYVRA